MKTQERLNQTIYIVDETGRIEEDVFQTIIEDYFRDETTTPKGVAPRIHIRENKEEGTYELWTWGVLGNNPQFIRAYETEEEAENAQWECWIDNFDNDDGSGLNDAPIICFTKEEAVEVVNEIKQ